MEWGLPFVLLPRPGLPPSHWMTADLPYSQHESSPGPEACGVGALEVSVVCPEFAGSWPCHICCEAVTLDSDSEAM